MSKFEIMPGIELVTLGDWSQLKVLRLAALQESQKWFLGQYEDQNDYTEAEWQAEFDRGDWYSVRIGDELVSLLGITTNVHEIAADERYLEYLWVSPDHRHAGVAHKMVGAVLDGLSASGVRTVFLWVLDGNEAAMDVYRDLGFTSTDISNPLPDLPGDRTEHKMKRVLQQESGDGGRSV